MKSVKHRIDQLLVQQGLAPSREKAQNLVLAGLVYVHEQRVQKSSESFSEDVSIQVKGQDHPFVSRGGLKLAGALKYFDIDVQGHVCIDVGASTGGFTDCLLQNGAQKIYSIDVGYGQFDWKLRQDSRVVLFEKTNFRNMNADQIPEKVDGAVIDVSFISLKLILPVLRTFLKPGAWVLPMVKPQFELSPQEVKKGVVQSEVLQQKAVASVQENALSLGYQLFGSIAADIKGPKGNQEYFLFLKGPESNIL
ncbi:MAG: TlyA family RNA methyltransferase [Deltaproteobacteria bacterium]|nr:TlyA family RNA methyltransferase [Deltaproteobacteria bacterium]